MVKRALIPFLLTALAIAVLTLTAKTLGPISFLVAFGAVASGAAAAGFSGALTKISLDKYLVPAQLTGVVAALGTILLREYSAAWVFEFVALFMLTVVLTRSLQQAPGALTWLLCTSAGVATGPLAGFLITVPDVKTLAGEKAPSVAGFLVRAQIQDSASLFPTALLGLALLVGLLHVTFVNQKTGPLLAGTFLTGLGFSGLLVMALEILPPEHALLAFGIAGFLGVTRTLQRPSDLLAPTMTPLLIRTVLFAILGFYIIDRVQSGEADPRLWPLMIIVAIPVFWSTQALAAQVRLMKPGGDRASASILAVHSLGLFLGAVTVKVASLFLGTMPAVALAAGFYLVAALVFSEERFWPFAKTLLSQPG